MSTKKKLNLKNEIEDQKVEQEEEVLDLGQVVCAVCVYVFVCVFPCIY